MKIITSPADRVKRTVQEAVQSSTGYLSEQSRVIEYTNRQWQILSRTKKYIYNNLLWLSWSREKIGPEFEQVLKNLAELRVNQNLSELELQDKACELFLSWKFESGNPYTVSKERVKLLFKWFDQLDSQNEIKILAMRHGHRKWEDLTETWVQEAQQAGRDFDFWSQDMIVGTHQLVIESILISLIWWSQWLSPQQAWEVLPQGRQEPYRTAQVTEFMFTKNGKWEKMMTVKTNNYEKSFSEEEVIKAYKHLKQTLI